MIKVFGHQSPDTDATGSAIIWAWYQNEHTGTDAEAFVLGELNTETQFVLNKWKVPAPKLLESVSAKDEVIVVDTNNPQELFVNINESTIIEIIDHHKLVGGLESASPLSITMRPLACTATVLYDLMGEHVQNLPEHIGGVLLSCIISDTLEFRSPTTTPHDKDVAEQLAAQLEIDINEYASEMFAAKSDISSFTDKGLITLDSKKFELSDKNLRVSVIETTDPKSVLERKEGIVAAISDLLGAENDVDEVLFFIVDILKEEATVLTHSPLSKQIIEKSYGVTVEGDTEILPGVVSRKKQIIPVLKM
ncbi:manganese-dependent inorganic pyrophosphatase [Candidatus Pacebacteria bacterium]|nr:manganese-dependent inorganic pyrophosphatase [Candidatus Paceibacterota bacterium]